MRHWDLFWDACKITRAFSREKPQEKQEKSSAFNLEIIKRFHLWFFFPTGWDFRKTGNLDDTLNTTIHDWEKPQENTTVILQQSELFSAVKRIYRERQYWGKFGPSNPCWHGWLCCFIVKALNCISFFPICSNELISYIEEQSISKRWITHGLVIYVLDWKDVSKGNKSQVC